MSELITVKVKPFSEIMKTFNAHSYRYTDKRAHFSSGMDEYCGKSIRVKPVKDAQYDYIYETSSEEWWFTKEWLDIPGKLDEEDYFIITELDEMLKYFLGAK
jgi:hypothetical protein